MERIRQHLGYANVTATLALIFAMSGGAIAATGGFSSGGQLHACVNGEGAIRLLKAGKKCKKGQSVVSWNETGPAGPAGGQGATGATGPQGAPGAPASPNTTVAHASTADTATSADSATTALTANNALALGGTPASDFTRSDCASTTGQVKGFAEVPPDPGNPLEAKPVSLSYSCSGEAVEVLTGFGPGEYVVVFKGNPAAIALATVNSESLAGDNTAAVHSVEPGSFQVVTTHDGADTDERFELLLP